MYVICTIDPMKGSVGKAHLHVTSVDILGKTGLETGCVGAILCFDAMRSR